MSSLNVSGSSLYLLTVGSSLDDATFELDLLGQDPCLCALSKRFVDKLGGGSVELLGSYQRGCSLDDHSEDTASLDLHTAEITSFAQTTQLLQRRFRCCIPGL